MCPQHEANGRPRSPVGAVPSTPSEERSSSPGSAEANSVGRPVDEEHDPDQLVPRHRAPRAGVAGLRAVVAHHEVRALRDVPGYAEMRAVGEPVLRGDVRLVQLHEPLLPGAPDPDEAVVVLLHRVAGETDHPLDERAAFAALESGFARRVEDDDVAAGRIAAEVETDAAGEHPVARVAEAAWIRGPLGAVEVRLHRRRRDAVRIDDPQLEREHDQDRAGDGEDPVERDPDAARQAGKEAGERIAAVPRPIAFLRGIVGEQVLPWRGGPGPRTPPAPLPPRAPRPPPFPSLSPRAAA